MSANVTRTETARTQLLASLPDFEAAGKVLTRFGLALVLLWIGGMKFTAYEAQGISGFVANSPFMSWAYSVFTHGTFSAILGLAEITTGLLILARPVSRWAALAGGLLGVGTFATTLTFLATTPGAWEPTLGGFPAVSVTGQFLMKDVVLFGASVWVFGEAVNAIRRRD